MAVLIDDEIVYDRDLIAMVAMNERITTAPASRSTASKPAPPSAGYNARGMAYTPSLIMIGAPSSDL